MDVALNPFAAGAAAIAGDPTTAVAAMVRPSISCRRLIRPVSNWLTMPVTMSFMIGPPRLG